MQSVYIETTIPSYLTGRKSKQQAIAADQIATRHWWDTERKHYRLFSSIFTIDEASGGDPEAAKLRLESLDGIRELEILEGFEQLEADIIALFRLPPKSVIDAAHLALAILHEMDYLLTWNCTHLANAVLQKDLIDYCGYHRLHFPIICTPRTLIELRTP
jgi:hypothetical protein